MRLVDHGMFGFDMSTTAEVFVAQLELIALPSSRNFLKAITLVMLPGNTAGSSVGGFLGYAAYTPDNEAVLSRALTASTAQVHIKDVLGWRCDYSGGRFAVV